MAKKPTLSSHLRDARLKRGLSVAEVAENTGVSVASIYLWETGRAQSTGRQFDRSLQGVEAANPGHQGDGGCVSLSIACRDRRRRSYMDWTTYRCLLAAFVSCHLLVPQALADDAVH